jgi:hypothetical protein
LCRRRLELRGDPPQLENNEVAFDGSMGRKCSIVRPVSVPPLPLVFLPFRYPPARGLQSSKATSFASATDATLYSNASLNRTSS